LGVSPERVAFVQDAHPEDAEEFRAYPPHCVLGTPEAEAVRELQALPDWQAYRHFQKNSIASHTSEAFVAWLEDLEASTIIAVGDVTDLCLYTLALFLQTRTLARSLGQRIIVPASCAQTWDAPDHPGDLYHLLFLHQLGRNGVEVVGGVR
jgi:nicotinamidase-related amidase